MTLLLVAVLGGVLFGLLLFVVAVAGFVDGMKR